MKKIIFILSAFIITFSSCKKAANCDSSVYNGESVMIPVTFIGFAPQEIDNIRVYRTNPDRPGKVDTFNLSKILWAYSSQSDQENLADRDPTGRDRDADGKIIDPLYSYLNNSTLILDRPSQSSNSKRDTLSNFAISKSKVSTDDKCHKDDPIVKVDAVSYKYKGITIQRDVRITIYKD